MVLGLMVRYVDTWFHMYECVAEYYGDFCKVVLVTLKEMKSPSPPPCTAPACPSTGPRLTVDFLVFSDCDLWSEMRCNVTRLCSDCTLGHARGTCSCSYQYSACSCNPVLFVLM